MASVSYDTLVYQHLIRYRETQMTISFVYCSIVYEHLYVRIK